MTLPVFYTDAPLANASPGQSLPITGQAHHHAVIVRRMKAGEALELTDGAGLRVRGVLESASKEAATLIIHEVESEHPQTPRLGLIQALAKGDRDLAAVETAVEVGVDVVVPWQAQRSIVQWKGSKAAKAHDKWANLIQAAALQSRRVNFPQLEQLSSTSFAVQKAREGALVIVLHESGTRPFVQTLRSELSQREAHEIYVVVGPEGGITDAEQQQMQEAGAVTAVLGPTVLRASSAGPIALALAQQELGHWDPSEKG